MYRVPPAVSERAMTFAHLASSHVEAPSDFTFCHLSDGRKLGRWALGSVDLKPGVKGHVCHGVSLFDESAADAEIRPHPTLDLIDFHFGPNADRRPRVSIRVTPGADWGLNAQTCLVAITTWRDCGMTDDRWQRTCRTHDLEVLLFKAQIETDWGRQ